MKKLSTFLRTWTKSLTEPNYYNHVVSAKISFSYKYFFAFYFFLSLILSILYYIKTVPLIRQTSTDIIHELTTNYPQDLVITFQPGRMSLEGVDEPFHVPFPQTFSDLSDTSLYQHLFTFDTTTEVAAPDSLATFTASELIIRQADGRKQSYPLTDIQESFTIDRNAVGMFTSLTQTYVDRGLTYSPFILLLILSIFLPLINLFVLSIYTLFTLAVSSIWSKGLSYGKCYQIGLHTITFAETVRLLQDQLFSNVDISFFFSIAFFGATMIALYSVKPIYRK